MAKSRYSRYSIDDVAFILNLKVDRKQGAENYMQFCPFCGKGGYKFSFNSDKNTYHDFHSSCGASGNARDLYRNLSGRNFPSDKAVDREILDIMNGGEIEEEIISYKTKLEAEKLSRPQDIERATNEHCDIVYRAMLENLVLRKEHKEDLLKRGFTEKQIEKVGFKSSPTDRIGICRKLLSLGYCLEGVPGFFINKNGNWELSCPGPSYLCPVYDTEFNILLGFQVRLDKPMNDSKYLWVSSKDKEKGAPSGGPATYLYGKQKTTIIIEGILKATLVYFLLNQEYTVIGIAGVKQIKALEGYRDRIEGRLVMEAYDMDKYPTKDADELEIKKANGILEDANKLWKVLEEMSATYHHLKWDYNKEGYWNGNYKGLDDYLVSDNTLPAKFKSFIEKISK